MIDFSTLPLPDFTETAKPRRWAFLLLVTPLLALLLWLAHIPSQILIAAMLAGIFLAVCNGIVFIPNPLFSIAQGFVGCMIGRTVNAETMHDILAQWHLFVIMVLSVSVICTILGWFMAKSGSLPGTTAIWGTSPGAALIMTVMSEHYHADSRLVAFMQYLRVVAVTLIATGVAGMWGQPRQVSAAASVLGVDWPAFAVTCAIVLFGMVAGLTIRMPAGPMLVPMIVTACLNLYGYPVELPRLVLIAAYSIIGWKIGLRFTRAIVLHAARAFPKIMMNILLIIILCGIMGVVFGQLAGIDPLTAYLATSPGGMDAVAIISTSIGGNMSFIMAVQTTRFLVVSATSPWIASYVARKSGLTLEKDSEQLDT